MFKRYELHNHTSESDGNLSVSELINYMVEEKVDGVAITDHNTISGHDKALKVIGKNNINIDLIYGVELTSYYGHILCLNLQEYINWENINKNKPEIIFEQIRDKGGLVGIAHPFSKGYPYAKGCRWEMKINDYSMIDFIEVFNNPEPIEVNEKALELWEELVLDGYKISMTTGMDLHGRASMENCFRTYIKVNEKEFSKDALYMSIKNGQTFITKENILEAYINQKGNSYYISFNFHENNKKLISTEYILAIKTKGQKIIIKYTKGLVIELKHGINKGDSIIVKLYEKEVNINNLLAIAPVIYVN